MTGGIFLLKEDNNLVRMDETAYKSEALLQELLANYPELLAGDQIDSGSPRRWLLVKREMGVADGENVADRWALDHLFLDQDGIPTLVEVKRSTDTRLRREVVGQMLDYAANAVVHWPLEKIRSAFEARCEAENADPEEEMAEILSDEQDAESYWQIVKTNLQAGKVRMVFVADIIPPELQRIVEFLNQQMDPAEVLALEVKQYTGEKHKSLVPRVIGQTAEALLRKSIRPADTRSWDEPSFFDTLSRNASPDAVLCARQFLEWSKNNTQVRWGHGTRNGSFLPLLVHEGNGYKLAAAYTSGELEINFQHYAKKDVLKSEKMRNEILSRFNAIDGVAIPADAIARRPSVPFDVLSKGNRMESALRVFDWLVEQIRGGKA